MYACNAPTTATAKLVAEAKSTAMLAADHTQPTSILQHYVQVARRLERASKATPVIAHSVLLVNLRDCRGRRSASG